MALVSFTKGQIIHSPEQDVTTAELVLKGKVTVSFGTQIMTFSQGSIIGLSETAGEKYKYKYVAGSDGAIYSYAYEGSESLQKIIETNAKIAPMLTVKSVQNTLNAYYAYESFFNEVHGEYEKLSSELSDYPVLCKRAGVEPKSFDELANVESPERDSLLSDWQLDYLEALKENEKAIASRYYAIAPSISIGVIFQMNEIKMSIDEAIIDLSEFRKELNQKALSFNSEMEMVNVKLNAVKNSMPGNVDENGEVPLIQNAMDTILAFSDIDGEKMLEIKKTIEEYKALPDRRNTTDPIRRMRKKMIDAFFEIYEPCFLKARENPAETPAEVMMFLLFGFFDEEMAGTDNTETLYRLMSTYTPDPNNRICTIYQWFNMIMDGVVSPSRNEFEQDFEAFLREQHMHGDITDEEFEKMKVDGKEKFKYELNNLFKSGNRMTFGRISSYQPFFDSVNCMMDLSKGFMSIEKVNDILNRIKGIDKYVFRRDVEYNNPELDIKNLSVFKEVMPRIILFPNVGTRPALWQEIEGKRRDSHARMLSPIFLVEDLMKSMVALCGEYRWEITKTEQGVHWNDLKDLSLTSEYNDYIQFYRKNRELNADQKEKIKKQIQKAGSNLRREFVADYVVYMNSESNGSPLMNKVSRRILFTYCPFAAEYREKLKSIPMYQNELNKYETKTNEKLRPILNIIKKLEHDGTEVPELLREQVSFLES
ncbi:MAG: hypothetical protein K5851_05130 [Lachnospiraceae bacterium]|nr:hypothetical protein [Lachnospiraceae bacterium]